MLDPDVIPINDTRIISALSINIFDEVKQKNNI